MTVREWLQWLLRRPRLSTLERIRRIARETAPLAESTAAAFGNLCQGCSCSKEEYEVLLGSPHARPLVSHGWKGQKNNGSDENLTLKNFLSE